jgi:hypothetical protein
MLCKEIIAVRSEIHTKCINIRCGQNVEFVTLKVCGSLLAVLRSIIDIKAFVFTPLSPQLLNYELKTKFIFLPSLEIQILTLEEMPIPHRVPVYIEKLQVPESTKSCPI